MNARLPAARRAQLLLARMTLEEKFWQLFMAPGDPRSDTSWRYGAFGVQMLALREPGRTAVDAAAAANDAQRAFVERTRLGIPAIMFEEGVHGLMQSGASVFPSAVALAASWDTALMHAVASAIAAQSRRRGVRLLLAPVVNLARDQRWGRVEETYGEDAWLSAAMGVAYAGTLERAGVVATPKHFVANNGDGGRDSYPVAVDRATLEDLHFPPFRDAIRIGGARAVMASYNSVNGVPASASPDLLTRTLRGDWKFGGVVMSDQGGVGGANVLHHTAADYTASTAQAVRAGLDVIFQGGAHDAALFWPAFRDARIPPGVVDSSVARVLRLKFSLGLFDHPYASDSLAASSSAAGSVATAAALPLRAAEESAVLLRNERGTLPFGPSVRRVLLIGPTTLPLGGYTVEPAHATPLERGWRAGAPAGESLRVLSGPRLSSDDWTRVPPRAFSHDEATGRASGLRGEYFANASFEGAAAVVRTDATVDMQWTFNRPAPGVGTDWFSVRWTGVITVPAGEPLHLALEGDDGYRLWIDDVLAIDAERKVSFGRRFAPASLEPGTHALRIEYRQTTGNGRLRLLWDRRVGPTDDQLIADAVAAARDADAVVVVVGVDEGEFRDRSSLRLPGRQEELLARLADTGLPVVAVIAAGGAVIATPWIDRVSAALQVFYPGEAGAEALSRVVHGAANPAGRLPYTVPRSDGQLPLVYDHLPTGRGDDYIDLTGQPLFPFGYGLSYTSFGYSNLRLSTSVLRAADTVHVRFTVTNTGRVASDEVPQLYVRHVTAPTAQPVLALRGFARVALKPGESCELDLPLAAADLAVRDANGRRRVVPGDVIIYLGASSRDIRLRGTVHTQ